MDFRQLAITKARQYGIDPNLFVAQINQESRFNPRARSPVGAMGLGQLMPGTARDLGVSDPWNPEQNLDGAARYMAQQLKTFGSPELALAAYNAGPGNVRKHGGIPPFEETQNYVRTIMGSVSSMGGGAGSDTLVGGPDSLSRPPLPPIQGAPERETFNVPGLLGRILGLGEQQLPAGPEPEPEPDWLERKTKGWLTQDRRDRLALGLEGMTLNPNQAWMQALQGEISGRKEDAEARKAAAEQLRVAQNEQLARNQTVEWLMAQGREDLASAMLSGALPAGDAVKIAMQPVEDTRIPQIQAYEYARQQGYDGTFDEFVNPDQGSDQTALIQNFEYARSQGYDGSFQDFLQDQSGASKPGYMGTIPPGYQLVEVMGPDGRPVMRMEPIPGSPAEIEVTTLEDQKEKTSIIETVRADRGMQDIASIREMMQDGGAPTTGLIGGALSRAWPGSDAFNIRERLKTLEANMAFDRLDQMRQASPTGGALGQITERELEMLKASVANLSQFQSGPQFEEMLGRIEQDYMRILMKAAHYDVAEQYGFGPGRAPEPTASPNTNDPGRNNPTGWRWVQ